MTESNLLANLNSAQRRVVEQSDGPCLVLAGAGTGKTRTLVHRVAYLLERKVAAQQILLLTFTNKAAREMLGRVENLSGAKAHGLWGGTFHHVGNLLLRRFGARLQLSPSFTILDQEDNLALLKILLRERGMSRHKQDRDFIAPETLENVLSFSVNSQRPLAELIEERLSKHLDLEDRILELAKDFEKRRRVQELVNFDDLLQLWLRLLQECPDVKQMLGRQFSHILVDEYQDTNCLQGKILEQLNPETQNILVVGDDAQAIYAFRAATIENILRFPQVFPGAKIFRLEQNYRSTQAILNLANTILRQNRRQFEKELKTTLGNGSLPELLGCADNLAEARYIAQQIKRFQEKGETLSEMAVLFRAAYQALHLELALQKQGIPYLIRGGLRFFEQAHIKDVLAYLKITANPQDELSWARALKLEPGIGEKMALKVLQHREQLSEKLQVNAQKVLTRLEKLKGIKEVQRMLSYLVESFYGDYLQKTFENARERLDDLEALIGFAGSYATLEQFLSDTTLAEGFRGERSAVADKHTSKDYLVLSTIHQAKGLEWKKVFLVGLVEGQFPHYKSLRRRAELEEERRLFYVAVTRAKERLILTYPALNEGLLSATANQLSIFVRELSPELLNIKEEEIFSAEFEA